jgi:hypothetical protein
VADTVSESESPAIHSPMPVDHHPRTNRDWWPNQPNLQVLRQRTPAATPLGEDFNCAEAFRTLDVEALKRDMLELMTTSQDWWPADHGHYGPFFILSWHSAGSYWINDGRAGGGQGAHASRRSKAGRTTQASTRPAGSFGRSSRSTAGRSRGPISSCSPDPLAAATDIRGTFSRMAMNDEETAALIIGGHTFGNTHGNASPDGIGAEPEGAPIEQQGLGADQAGQRVPREPLRVRVGADEEPGRRISGHQRIPRPTGPCPTRTIRHNVTRRCCTATWARSALHRSVDPRAGALAGPGPGGRPRADRRRGDRGVRGDDPRLRAIRVEPRRDGTGCGGELPRHRQAWWRQRRPAAPRAAEGLGGQRAWAASATSWRRWSRSSASSTPPRRAAGRSRSPT